MSRSWIQTLLVVFGLLAIVGGLLWWRGRSEPDPAIFHGKVRRDVDPGQPRPGIAPHRPDTAHVILELVDGSGSPIVDALVLIDGQGGAESDGWTFGAVGQRTDASGRAIFHSVPFGRWPIYVPAPSFEPLGRKAIAIDASRVEPGTTLEFEIPVRRRAVVQANVRDGRGDPVPFVDLDLLVTPVEGSSWHQPTTTDAEGAFEVFVPQRGTASVRARVTSPGYRTTDAATFELEDATPPRPIDVIVAPVALRSFG